MDTTSNNVVINNKKVIMNSENDKNRTSYILRNPSKLILFNNNYFI